MSENCMHCHHDMETPPEAVVALRSLLVLNEWGRGVRTRGACTRCGDRVVEVQWTDGISTEEMRNHLTLAGSSPSVLLELGQYSIILEHHYSTGRALRALGALWCDVAAKHSTEEAQTWLTQVDDEASMAHRVAERYLEQGVHREGVSEVLAQLLLDAVREQYREENTTARTALLCNATRMRALQVGEMYQIALIALT